jgi:hypothetical protein
LRVSLSGENLRTRANSNTSAEWLIR